MYGNIWSGLLDVAVVVILESEIESLKYEAIVKGRNRIYMKQTLVADATGVVVKKTTLTTTWSINSISRNHMRC